MKLLSFFLGLMALCALQTPAAAWQFDLSAVEKHPDLRDRKSGLIFEAAMTDRGDTLSGGCQTTLRGFGLDATDAVVGSCARTEGEISGAFYATLNPTRPAKRFDRPGDWDNIYPGEVFYVLSPKNDPMVVRKALGKTGGVMNTALVSIDELQQQFTYLSAQVAANTDHIAGLTDRMEVAEMVQVVQNERLDGLDEIGRKLNGRLTAVEAEQANTNSRLTSVEDDQSKLAGRVTDVDTKLSQAIAEGQQLVADTKTAILNEVGVMLNSKQDKVEVAIVPPVVQVEDTPFYSWPYFWPLLGIAAGFVILGLWLFFRRKSDDEAEPASEATAEETPAPATASEPETGDAGYFGSLLRRNPTEAAETPEPETAPDETPAPASTPAAEPVPTPSDEATPEDQPKSNIEALRDNLKKILEKGEAAPAEKPKLQFDADNKVPTKLRKDESTTWSMIAGGRTITVTLTKVAGSKLRLDRTAPSGRNYTCAATREGAERLLNQLYVEGNLGRAADKAA